MAPGERSGRNYDWACSLRVDKAEARLTLVPLEAYRVAAVERASTMHHKMLDLGAYRLSEDRRVVVSERVNGSHGVNEWLLSFHGRGIRMPQRTTYVIRKGYIAWHVREVSKAIRERSSRTDSDRQ